MTDLTDSFSMGSDNPTRISEPEIQRVQTFVWKLLKGVYAPMYLSDKAGMQMFMCEQVVAFAKSPDALTWQEIAQGAFLEVVKEYPFNHQSLPLALADRDD